MKKLSTFFATLLVSVLLIGSTSFAQTTWNAGAGTSDWNNAINWSAGVPTAAIDAIIDVTASPAPTMNAAGNCKNLSFTGVNGAFAGLTLVTGKILTVAGNVNLTGGKIVGSDGTIQVAGSWTKGTGSFLTGTSTVQFNGASSQTITDINTFNNLQISSTVTLTTAITVGGVLTIDGGKTLNDGGQTINLVGTNGTPFVRTGTYTTTGTMSYQNGAATNVALGEYNNLDISKSGVTFTAAGALSVGGNFSIGTGTTFAAGAALVHTIRGNFTNSGTFQTNTSTMTFNGAAAQSIAGVTYSNLTIANTTATVSFSSSPLVTGTLTVNTGATLSDNGNQISNSGGTLTIAGTGKLQLGSTAATTMPTFTTFTAGAGTVEFASTANQTVDPQANYWNVLLSGGTKTASNNLVTNNDFTISSGATFVDNAKTITVNGRWTNSGTYTATGTVAFASATATTIPAETFNNLSVNDNSRTALGNITVNGIFNIAGGTFVDGGKTISIGGTWTGTGGYTATGTVVFVGSGPQTISTAEGFNNLTISSGTVTAQGALTVAGPLTIGSGATFVAGALTHALSGGLSNSGTLTATNSTINFAATSSITANSATSFATANVTAGTVTLAGTNNITVATGMIVSAGATLVTGTNSVIGGGFFSNLGTLSFGNTAGITSAVQVSGAATFATTGSYILTGTNQVTGSTGGAFPATVVDLTFAGSGTITLDKAVTLTGDLSLVSGNVGNGTSNLTIPDTKTITVTAGTLTTNPGAAGTYKLVYANTGEFTTGKEVPTGVATLSHLTTAAGKLNIGSATVVNGTLTLGGLVSTSANTLIVSSSGAAIAGVSATKYIDGKLGWGFAATTATTRIFPIGTGTIYRPVQMGLNASAATTVYVQMVNSSATALGLTLGAGLGGVSNVRYYETSQTNGAATLTGPTIKLHYDTDESVTDNANVVVAQNQAGTWTNIGGSPGTNPNVGDVITGATAYANTFGKFTIANASGGTNALAVELVSFTGTSKENTVSLSWTTATEHDNYGFNIERTVTGKSEWSEVGFVKGSGTSNSPKTYSFTDKVSGAASFDYRIKQTDVDGLSRYIGSVITVTAPIPTEFALSQNYPNPFNPSTIIKYAIPQASFVTLKIYNMLGQEVATLVNGQTDIGFHSITWNGRTNSGSFASSGVYIYRIVAGDFVQVKKMNFLK